MQPPAEYAYPDQWDEEGAELVEPQAPQTRRTVVSVAFPKQDFELVAESAARIGMKLSEYIRTAVLRQAKEDVFRTSFTHGVASGAFYPWPSSYVPPLSGIAGRVAVEEAPNAA